jgi:hypothetical protein
MLYNLLKPKVDTIPEIIPIAIAQIGFICISAHVPFFFKKKIIKNYILCFYIYIYHSAYKSNKIIINKKSKNTKI